MNHLKILKVFSFLAAIITIANCDCKDYINSTCNSNCDTGELYCKSDLTDDILEATIKNISTFADESGKHFKLFNIWGHNELVHLKADIFRDITFDEIIIYGPYLKTIDQAAFTGTNLITRTIQFERMPALTSSASSFFQALSSFVNLEELSINNCNITEIPSNAFESVQGKQEKMTKIVFNDVSLKIGSNAFSELNNLTEISFLNIKEMKNMPAYAFSFDQASSNLLTISISYYDSEHTNQMQFNELSFVNIQRPAILNIEYKYKILDEQVFLPFLLENTKNKLNVSFDKFDCDDCANYWIEKNGLAQQFIGIKCSSKKSFDDPKNFKGCSTKIGQVIKPCIHNKETLICGGYDSIDLKTIFDKLSKLKFEQKNFQTLILNNTAITALTDNTFSGITFDEIYIKGCHNLQTIENNVFNGTDQVTKTLIIENNSRLSSPTNSIWQIIGNFIKLEVLYLNHNNITEIPSNAFENYQEHLKEIQLLGRSFEKLGSKAFGKLNALKTLTFDTANFEIIPEYAFFFTVNTNEDFHLTLSHLPNINSTGFANNSLVGSGRNMSIDFYPANEMELLSSIVFETFLMENEKNKINFHSNRIDCSDCRNIWVKNNTKIQPRLLNLLCTNGKTINDPDNFRC